MAVWLRASPNPGSIGLKLSTTRRLTWGVHIAAPPVCIRAPRPKPRRGAKQSERLLGEAQSLCTVGPCRLGWTCRLFPAGPNSLSGMVAFAGCKADGDYQLLAGMLLECCGRGAHAVLFPALRSARGFYCILEVYWVTETLLKTK